MAKRNRKEEPLGAPRTSLSSFGWCVDSQHDGCRKQFVYHETTYVCSCDCHKEGKDDSN